MDVAHQLLVLLHLVAFAALLGGGSSSARLVVVDWRLPVAIAAVVFGAMLGVGGAIFQSLTRNPLGSPDVIGFDSGAYAGALVVIILFHGSFYGIAAGALVGGILSAVLVYALAWRGGVQGFRLIIVGIGVASGVLSSLAGAGGSTLSTAGVRAAGLLAMYWLLRRYGLARPEQRGLAAAVALAWATLPLYSIYGLTVLGQPALLRAALDLRQGHRRWLAWAVCGLSLGAISLLLILIKRGAVARVASLFYLVPPVVAVLAFVLFGEQLTVWQGVGMAVAAAGVAVASRG